MDNAINWKDTPAALTEVCEYSGMLYYAGRADDFVEFLGQFDNRCQNRRPGRPIVAAGSISRLIEDRASRERTGSTLPLVYMSDADLVVCDQDPGTGYPTWRNFLDRARKAPWRACDPDSLHWLSQRMELAYDATHAFLLAVQHLRPLDTRVDRHNAMRWLTPIPLTSGAVWQSLSKLDSIDGITGFINFAENRVPRQKWAALLQVDEIGDWAARPTMLYHCGRATSKDPVAADACSPGKR